ncbi:MAG: Ig-like domain-containing protein [Tannerella sp.]|nr:Ig-like domain-containing protein [Tannerella sp.]
MLSWVTAFNDCGDVESEKITFTPTCPSTVTSVTVSPSSASVEKGKTQQFTATVAGTGDPARTVTWSVSGNLVHLEEANATEAVINRLQRGIYIVKIVMEGNKIEMRKVLIK